MTDTRRKLSREEILEIVRVAREYTRRPNLNGTNLGEANLQQAKEEWVAKIRDRHIGDFISQAHNHYRRI